MLTLITGAPGAGKTAALVQLLGELAKDRLVYVNGIPDLLVPHIELPDPKQWTALVPDGSIVVIDEVQRVWRPRGPGQKVPDDVAGLETHRHRGLDFYIVTQGPNLLDKNVRALVGRHVHLRDVGVLGRYWYEWPECSDNVSWKSAPIKKKWRLPKAAFSQYKSASVHIKPLRSFPMALVFAVVALVGMAYAGWSVYGSVSKKVQGNKAPAGPQASASAPIGGARSGGRLAAPRTALQYRQESTPVVPNRPETAPMFDHLRQVRHMPLVQGGFCSVELGCRCYLQGGIPAPIEPAVCADLIGNPKFDPYRAPATPAPRSPARTDRPASPPPEEAV